MEILINNNKADITLENEKTVSDIILSLEKWLKESFHRLSGLVIDGQAIQPDKINEVFSKNIDSIKSINIITNSIAELSMECLLTVLKDIREFENLSNEDKNTFSENWKKSPVSFFTQNTIPDLYEILVNVFSAGSIAPSAAISITEERIREVKNPKEELEKLKPLLDETCIRLSDLSLDIQTGKDLKAAQTIQLFTGFTEKILRIAYQLEIQGLINLLNINNQDEKPIKQIIQELSSIINDLYTAYEKHDTVLTGDIAEYEACPKLQELFNALQALKNNSEKE